LARAEEGGPVAQCSGVRALALTTFGPRPHGARHPAATIERIVPALLRMRRIARANRYIEPLHNPPYSWLMPLHDEAGPVGAGLMVMSIVDGGPAAKAGHSRGRHRIDRQRHTDAQVT